MKPEIVIKDSEIEGKGIFANKNFKKGEQIGLMEGEKISLDEVIKRVNEGKEGPSDPLQIGDEKYIDLNEPWRSTNHSCSPNTFIKGENKLIAIKNINRGEITFDYSATMDDNEDKIKKAGRELWTCKCNCKSKNCRKLIGEFRDLPIEIKNFYLKNKMVPDFIFKKFSKKHNP